MNGYADHGGAKNATVKDVAGLIDFQNGAIGMFLGLGTIHSLVKMRIEGLALRVDAFGAEAREVVNKLFVDELEAFAVVVVFGFAMRSKGMLEAVDNGNELFDHSRGCTLAGLAVFFVGALAVIGEVRLMANQGLADVFEFRGELFCFGIIALDVIRRVFSSPPSFGGRLKSISGSFMNASSILEYAIRFYLRPR